MDPKNQKINKMWNKKLNKYDERMMDPLKRHYLGRGILAYSLFFRSEPMRRGNGNSVGH